jgi:hypothetical protein
MAARGSSPLTFSDISSEVYSTRYDETQLCLRSLTSSAGIEPSKSKLAGSVNMTAHVASHGSPGLIFPREAPES